MNDERQIGFHQIGSAMVTSKRKLSFPSQGIEIYFCAGTRQEPRQLGQLNPLPCEYGRGFFGFQVEIERLVG
jgi:hypothetical protein